MIERFFSETTYIPPLDLPKQEIVVANRYLDGESGSRLAFVVTFIIYPKSYTIGIHARLSRQASSTKWADRMANQAAFYKEVFEHALFNTLLSVADEFGGPLHMTENSVVVRGDKAKLLSVLNVSSFDLSSASQTEFAAQKT
jgi:hypothetical protein